MQSHRRWCCGVFPPKHDPDCRYAAPAAFVGPDEYAAPAPALYGGQDGPGSATVRVFRDGAAWSALSGPNLQAGVAGFGDTPADALRDFIAQIDLTPWPEG